MIIYKKDLKSSFFSPFDLHIKSIRPKKGEIIMLSDLKGLIIKVEVVAYDHRIGIGSYKIINELLKAKAKKRTLIQAQIDKVYLDKLCELLPIASITELIIVPSDLSQSQAINIDRLNNICIRSCEQSENPHLPEIQIIEIPMVEYLKTIKEKPLVLELPKKNSSEEIFIYSDCILVGPEGGFSNNEMQFLESNYYQQVSINEQVIPSWLAGYSYYSNLKVF